jgi:hypothetical protein
MSRGYDRRLYIMRSSCPGVRRICNRQHGFLDPLVVRRSKRAQTVGEIARRYCQFVDLFERKDASVSSVASSSVRPEYRSSMEG